PHSSAAASPSGSALAHTCIAGTDTAPHLPPVASNIQRTTNAPSERSRIQNATGIQAAAKAARSREARAAPAMSPIDATTSTIVDENLLGSAALISLPPRAGVVRALPERAHRNLHAGSTAARECRR